MIALRLPQSLTALITGLGVLAATATDGFAQDVGGVTGRVVSTIGTGTGDAVPGVTIRFPELRLGAVTDDQGRFEFTIVPAGRHEIRAEFFGCALASQTVEVRKGERSAIQFSLSQPPIPIPELLVTGLASKASVVELPFAVGRMDPEEVDRRAARTIADLVRGEFPGVRVLQGSGLPGKPISIQFRGPSSISREQQPLVVVDGAPTAGGLIDLNPRDVRSITVLKGSAAAAHYGARGQAGVIEITTKDAATSSSVRPGPLVIVNGALSQSGLTGIDPESIKSVEMVTGPAAGVLFGARAVETGVLRIRTRKGSAAEEDKNLFSRCVDPSP